MFSCKHDHRPALCLAFDCVYMGQLVNGSYSTLGRVVEQNDFVFFFANGPSTTPVLCMVLMATVLKYSFTLIVQQGGVRSVGKQAAIQRKPFLGFEGGWHELLV